MPRSSVYTLSGVAPATAAEGRRLSVVSLVGVQIERGTHPQRRSPRGAGNPRQGIAHCARRRTGDRLEESRAAGFRSVVIECRSRNPRVTRRSAPRRPHPGSPRIEYREAPDLRPHRLPQNSSPASDTLGRLLRALVQVGTRAHVDDPAPWPRDERFRPRRTGGTRPEPPLRNPRDSAGTRWEPRHGTVSQDGPDAAVKT
jgi:hypothetical protein